MPTFERKSSTALPWLVVRSLQFHSVNSFRIKSAIGHEIAQGRSVGQFVLKIGNFVYRTGSGGIAACDTVRVKACFQDWPCADKFVDSRSKMHGDARAANLIDWKIDQIRKLRRTKNQLIRKSSFQDQRQDVWTAVKSGVFLWVDSTRLNCSLFIELVYLHGGRHSYE